MTPPVAQGDRHTAGAPEAPPAVSVCPPAADLATTGPAAADLPAAPTGAPAISTLLNRPDFLRAASARRQGTASFLLQGRDRRDGDPQVRIGFTASKKAGNAVIRNRAKRRMRALAREVLPRLARAGWDYVLVARPEATVSRPFADMLRDLEDALASVHGTSARGNPTRGDRPRTGDSPRGPHKTPGKEPAKGPRR